MELLYEHSDNMVQQVDESFFRYLMSEINWDQRMLSIQGPRGSGKTTLMLQYMKYKLDAKPEESLYITADHYWFYNHNLVQTADQFYKNGGKYLFIDEVHKYPRWSTELKNIYDRYKDMRVVFSSSSALNIYRGTADLSRRVLTYQLPGLSFREFLILSKVIDVAPISWDDLVKSHAEIALHISQNIKPLKHFKQYLQYGYLPIFNESSIKDVPIRLNQIINTILDVDLAFIEDYNTATAHKLRKLLAIIAESAPFKPNVSALARKIDASRDSIYSWLVNLEKARLLNFLFQKGKGVSLLQKPEKIYLENPNLISALKPLSNAGAIRESFMINQLKNAGMQISQPKSGDVYCNDYYIEIGGQNKSSKQVNHEENFIVAKDNIETGRFHNIPLWLFGFLY